MRPSRTLPAVVLAGLLGSTALVACGSEDVDTGSEPTVTAESSPEDDESSPEADSGSESPEARRVGPMEVTGTVTDDLQAPWGLDFLPNGDAVLTERDTRRVLRIDPESGEQTELGVVEPATPNGEGGLLGVAVSPDFASDRTLFLYYTTGEDNRLARATLEGDTLGEPEVILDGIPLNTYHDGGRLAFGPDGMLYVSTGDAGNPDLSQDPESLAGKVLRMTPDGEVPRDNPTRGSLVYTLGHRNVQGLAFDDSDRLWASEFGDQTFDELNRLEPGGNFGWPVNEGQGDVQGGELINPQVVWSTDDASPSGLAYADGMFFVAALQGERVWRVPLEGSRAGEPQDFFTGEYGRIREIKPAPDGDLWVITNNTDTRGEPREGDDRILRVTTGVE
ncbi:sorbosone dehydrogenase family protein [Nocardioides sp. CFH 31398]|uniref:PQQ-dependent sugar dehydrogenase n=1 Tax=Nocardioides sp. CFH 31398 TaxID=2919579 RepID=UPI001F060A3A|nr:PQQ-dependent sugar dehydrogenase [Nocardioides sp. CFH 31398]MCH1867298.1 PQQ-dependent sugar dehydrogenase [Nocardioides sp. CFH 31398]